MAEENMAEETVTISEFYFKILLRRAEYHVEQPDDEASIRIEKSVHETLIRDSREYHNLKQALFREGVAPDALAVLVQETDFSKDAFDGQAQTWLQQPVSFHKPGIRPERIGGHPDGNWRIPTISAQETLGALKHGREIIDQHAQHRAARDHASIFRSSIVPPHLDTRATTGIAEEALGEVSNSLWSEPFGRKAPRQDHTLLFTNLPSDVTIKEITKVIRGAGLIDIWLRRTERAAVVTLPEGAHDFLTWSKKNDIFIQHKRLLVTWNDRQATVPAHMLSKLANGHSRNLVIRNAQGRLTERQIRDYMEHIHNLVITAFIWAGQDVYLSTNSIDKATFARNCMLSRLHYKGLKIEWYSDECAEPLPKYEEPFLVHAKRDITQRPTPRSVINRFDLLSMDDEETSADEPVPEDEASTATGILLLPRSTTSSTIA